ncbi:uncharacterized protein LOC122282508 [Carya illinoinensis]|uniref:uncharacterized protein LOC122282508 n=1 Tax=Carya illinoinensis TaxID=32201 RepID=UPI001C71EE22|nr:uncharacterized protein LOC122282508 [Carya illinoinensis]
MAEGTCFAQLAEVVSMLKGETVHLRKEQEHHKNMLEAVLQQLNNLATSYEQLAVQSTNQVRGEESSRVQGQFNQNPLFDGNGGIHARSLRLDFPKFDGTEPMEWILKAQQFFAYFKTPEDQKLQIAFFHMEGKALSWYCWLMDSGPIGGWDEFISALKVRFGPSTYEDPVGAFTKLRQTTTVEEYQTEFEMLSNRISGLTEDFRISTFISGLRDDLKIMVTMLKPNTISAAFGLAKLQEEEVTRRNKGMTSKNHSQYIPTNPYIPKLPAPTPLMREKGLCYYCDEKYHFGHKCTRPKLFLLEGLGEEREEEEEADNSEGNLAIIQAKDPVREEKEIGELLGISLHAMAGSLAPKTMRIEGFINHQKVLVLIDTGSTHSFVDSYVARRSRLPVGESQLTVKVANGDSLPCQGYCRVVSIQLQNLGVKANLYLLTLGGCDVVLGVDWLRGLGSILWNFSDLIMQFNFRGSECKLQGLQPPRESLEEGEHIPKFKKGVVKGVWLHLIGAEVKITEPTSIPSVLKIVKDFEGLFSEPHGLPPPRSHDHKIVLQENSKPMCVRPYRYPYYQKAEIEKLVTEMLSSGVIRGSQSPYSSPVLLVRKADGSWRMCVDYRALNKDTVKDKYPIPNIDELLDELFGAEIFSKLDLRSSYHQIRIKLVEDHLQHLRIVLETLQSHHLFAKQSKCSWPLPKSLKALRGFLGLTGYYKKFVQGYGTIAAPLTALLRKNSFVWSDKAQAAFNRLKEAMVSPPVLKLPDFTKSFVVECDASGEGLRAVLMQKGRPIAYLSQGLKGRSLMLSTYEKELLALVMAIRKWRHYLVGQHFKVRTDQQALKYLLEQRVGTPAQQKWVSKLLGYDFSVEYRSGKPTK